MDSLKEIFDALNSRIRSPIFGSIAIIFILVNWQPLFFLIFADVPVVDKFTFFENHTSWVSLYLKPILAGLIFALASPWIALFSFFLADNPTTKRKIKQTQSTDKILVEKINLEQTRIDMRAQQEQAQIASARRDEEVNEIQDPKIREDLQNQIDEIRKQRDAENQLINTSGNLSGYDKKKKMLDDRIHSLSEQIKVTSFQKEPDRYARLKDERQDAFDELTELTKS